MRFGKNLLEMRLCADDAVKQEQFSAVPKIYSAE